MDSKDRLTVITRELKETVKNLMQISATLIDRNSQIDHGNKVEQPEQPIGKFESTMEDFISSCNTLELNLRTIQECLIQARSSQQNLPISMSNMRFDVDWSDSDSQIPANSTVSWNEYLCYVNNQVKSMREIQGLLKQQSGPPLR